MAEPWGPMRRAPFFWGKPGGSRLGPERGARPAGPPRDGGRLPGPRLRADKSFADLTGTAAKSDMFLW